MERAIRQSQEIGAPTQDTYGALNDKVSEMLRALGADEQQTATIWKQIELLWYGSSIPEGSF